MNNQEVAIALTWAREEVEKIEGKKIVKKTFNMMLGLSDSYVQHAETIPPKQVIKTQESYQKHVLKKIKEQYPEVYIGVLNLLKIDKIDFDGIDGDGSSKKPISKYKSIVRENDLLKNRALLFTSRNDKAYKIIEDDLPYLVNDPAAMNLVLKIKAVLRPDLNMNEDESN